MALQYEGVVVDDAVRPLSRLLIAFHGLQLIIMSSGTTNYDSLFIRLTMFHQLFSPVPELKVQFRNSSTSSGTHKLPVPELISYQFRNSYDKFRTSSTSSGTAKGTSMTFMIVLSGRVPELRKKDDRDELITQCRSAM